MKTFLAIVGVAALLGVCLLGWAGTVIFGAKVHQGVELPTLIHQKESADTSNPTLYVWGYGTADTVVKAARAKCPDCRLVILTSIDDNKLPKGKLAWIHIASQTATMPDRCATGSQLKASGVKFAIANNPCE